MSERPKETRCKRVGYAYAGSNPAPPTSHPLGAARARRCQDGPRFRRPAVTMRPLVRLPQVAARLVVPAFGFLHRLVGNLRDCRSWGARGRLGRDDAARRSLLGPGRCRSSRARCPRAYGAPPEIGRSHGGTRPKINGRRFQFHLNAEHPRWVVCAHRTPLGRHGAPRKAATTESGCRQGHSLRRVLPSVPAPPYPWSTRSRSVGACVDRRYAWRFTPT